MQPRNPGRNALGIVVTPDAYRYSNLRRSVSLNELLDM
jgi:hypothetical protein